MKRFKLLGNVIAAVVFLWNTDAAAQTIRYVYDGTGNRILRTIVLSSARQGSAESDSLQTIVYEEIIADTKFLIYPNPTSGTLRIEIPEDPSLPITEAMLSVYSLSGSVLGTMPIENNAGTLDLSGYPHGVYLLRIESNNHSTTWRIIKE